MIQLIYMYGNCRHVTYEKNVYYGIMSSHFVGFMADYKWIIFVLSLIIWNYLPITQIIGIRILKRRRISFFRRDSNNEYRAEVNKKIIGELSFIEELTHIILLTSKMMIHYIDAVGTILMKNIFKFEEKLKRRSSIEKLSALFLRHWIIYTA